MQGIFTLLFLLTTLSCLGEPKVVLHLLDHTDKKPTTNRFWITWSEEWRSIEKTKTIEGKEAEAIIEQLKISLKMTESMNLCGHDPIYGIVATEGNDKTFKTSLCFKCVTWVMCNRGKDYRMHIDGEDGIDNPLCLLLRKHIELPEAVIKLANKKKVVQ